MKNWINLVLALIAIVIFGLRTIESITFKQNVSGYLKRAADANTIDLAHEELTRAIDYLEANNLTSGYTSIIYKTPDEDIGFWYKNLKASQNELATLNSESALEKTNVLIKLRETLMDGGKKTSVTVPKGMSVFPNNLLWAVLSWIAVFCGFGAFVSFAVYYDKEAKAAVKNED